MIQNNLFNEFKVDPEFSNSVGFLESVSNKKWIKDLAVMFNSNLDNFRSLLPDEYQEYIVIINKFIADYATDDEAAIKRAESAINHLQTALEEGILNPKQGIPDVVTVNAISKALTGYEKRDDNHPVMTTIAFVIPLILPIIRKLLVKRAVKLKTIESSVMNGQESGKEIYIYRSSADSSEEKNSASEYSGINKVT